MRKYTCYQSIGVLNACFVCCLKTNLKIAGIARIAGIAKNQRRNSKVCRVLAVATRAKIASYPTPNGETQKSRNGCGLGGVVVAILPA